MHITDEVYTKAMNRDTKLDINREYQYLREMNPNVLLVADTGQECLQPVSKLIHADECFNLVDRMVRTGHVDKNELLYLREQLNEIRFSEYFVDYKEACRVVRDSVLTLNYLTEMQEHANKAGIDKC